MVWVSLMIPPFSIGEDDKPWDRMQFPILRQPTLERSAAHMYLEKKCIWYTNAYSKYTVYFDSFDLIFTYTVWMFMMLSGNPIRQQENQSFTGKRSNYKYMSWYVMFVHFQFFISICFHATFSVRICIYIYVYIYTYVYIYMRIIYIHTTYIIHTVCISAGPCRQQGGACERKGFTVVERSILEAWELILELVSCDSESDVRHHEVQAAGVICPSLASCFSVAEGPPCLGVYIWPLFVAGSLFGRLCFATFILSST